MNKISAFSYPTISRPHGQLLNYRLPTMLRTIPSPTEKSNKPTSPLHHDLFGTVNSVEIPTSEEQGLSSLSKPKELENDSTIDNANFRQIAKPVLLLNIVAIIWGSQHAVIKMVIGDSDPAAFTFTRFALATLLVSPFTPSLRQAIKYLTKNKNLVDISTDLQPNDESRNLNNTIEKDTEDNEEQMRQSMLAWKWGLEMGFWMFLGYFFQALGLEVSVGLYVWSSFHL